MKAAATYARFSSDLQKDRSIDDQNAVMFEKAKSESLKVVISFHDRARTSATLFDRDGLRDMMRAAKERKFDVLIVESLDRLSRDQEDLPGLFKRLTFYGVQILTLNEGYVTSLHVGIRGITGSLFLKDLADKVRRGQGGRIREGKLPGTVTYGYRKVLGKPGEREIDPVQAAIVRRIFQEYANGKSPRSIAADLNRDSIPTPRGAATWHYSSFLGLTGGLKNKTGLLSNRIYIGEVIWNANRTVLNPDTGKKLKRAVPEAEHVRHIVPHLRIIEQDLWDAAEAMRQKRSVPHRTGRRQTLPRSQHLLLGLLRCEQCGGLMRINSRRRGRPLVACATAHQRETCSHRKHYDLGHLEKGILEEMGAHLTDPDWIAEVARGYHAEWAERNKKNRAEGAALRKQLSRVEVQIDRLVDAISNSTVSVKALTVKLEAAEAERAGLAQRLERIEADTNVVDLHPQALKSYQEAVRRLHNSYSEKKAFGPADRVAFHNLIEAIIIHPTAPGAPYEFTPLGRLGALMGADLFPTIRTPSEILREQGVARFDIVGAEKGGPTISHHAKVVPLGRWRAAS